MANTVDETYQKLEQREHVLTRPTMYIGSTGRDIFETWTYNDETQKMETTNLTYTPAFVKIFDEILTNATDHAQRDETVRKICVDINVEQGSISVLNDGNGISNEKSQKHQIHAPELIFGHLNSGSNYNDDEKRLVGGTNGLGAKLTNIFSRIFVIETVCDGKKYIQYFRDNLSKIEKPKITKYTRAPYTRITYIPDYDKFDMKSLDDDTFHVLKKRTLDAAAVTNKRVSVFFNGEKLDIKDFQSYINYYIGDIPRVCALVNDRWEIAVCINPFESRQQVSFVNGISTSKGGPHVDHVMKQLVDKISDHIKKQSKYKDLAQRSLSSSIKDHLMIFVKCLIENPEFDSQTKDCLTTKLSKFGSRCDISDDLLKKILKLGIVEKAIAFAQLKSETSLTKTDGTKKSRLIGIPKLEDANKAGTKYSLQCTLILTEGDSAKTFAISGLSRIGRDYYGVFPLRGKFLNVKEATAKQLLDNEELNNLKKIIGLQQGKKYQNDQDMKSLRYGSILVLSDADVDGFHIKGLVFNLFETFWPDLFKRSGFLKAMVTPAVKAKKGNQTLVFHSHAEFVNWCLTNSTHGWKIKYYKGLGTSTAVEAKECFSEFKQNTRNYDWFDEEDTKAMILAFRKDKADARKVWIQEGTRHPTLMDDTLTNIRYKMFIDNELRLFSIADTHRSIPNICDGLKPSQRKILYACFHKKITQEIKVAQLAGIIGAETAYHHGEASLHSTIIKLSQNYVGSNNINYLAPVGQFGTRLDNGKDAAQPRYIFTHLTPLATLLFNPLDNVLLNYEEDDGMKVEPTWYLPILPTVLLNGTEGIGTGYSTGIPSYNPLDIVENLKRLIVDEDSDMVEMVPWYRGFKGNVVGTENGNYLCYGQYQRVDRSKVRITEIPLGKNALSISGYKEFLESVLYDNVHSKNKKRYIHSYDNHGTDEKVDFTVVFSPDVLDELIENKCFEKEMNLVKSINISNMYLFDDHGFIRQYDSVEEIIWNFYKIRLTFYEKRWHYLMEKLENEKRLLEEKVRFVMMVINEELIVFKKKKDIIIQEMIELGFVEIDKLLSMKLWLLTEEKIQELLKERDNKLVELEDLRNKNPSMLWLEDLDEFVTEYNKWLTQ